MRMMAGYGSKRMSLEAPCFSSRCQWIQRVHKYSIRIAATTDQLRSSDGGTQANKADDAPALRGSIGRLLRSVDLDVRLFASIPDFLEFDPPDGPTCLVLDVT